MMKRLGGMLLGLALATFAAPAFGEDAKIVLIAGRPSHGKGEHEFNAGMKLLAKCLKEVPGVNPVYVGGGWPADEPSSTAPRPSSSSWTAAAATRSSRATTWPRSRS